MKPVIEGHSPLYQPEEIALGDRSGHLCAFSSKDKLETWENNNLEEMIFIYAQK